MKKLYYNTPAVLLLFMVSFLLMSFHPRNNFRIEKRHYRKGFYVDLWFHPKTYPRTISSPQASVENENTDANVPASNGTSVQRATEIDDSKTSTDDIKPVSRSSQNASGTGANDKSEENETDTNKDIEINHGPINNAPSRPINRSTGNPNLPKPKTITAVPNN